MRKFYKITLLNICLNLFFFLSSFSQPGDQILLQGFNWVSWQNNWYVTLNAKMSEIKASGFNGVWLPPATDALSNEGYLPRELYNLNSKYGSQSALQSLIGTFHSNGIKVIADIVINHRVGSTNWADFQNPAWGCWSVAKDDEWTGACGNLDTGKPYGAARDLDHTNATVRTDLKAWMNWMKTTIGFDGWRYDFVTGYAPAYIKEYNDATLPYLSVGEYWDADKNNIQNWVNGTQGASNAFDFALKGVLQTAVNDQLNLLNDNGHAPGLIGINPTKSITFLDNHDTGGPQALWPFPGSKVMQGYAYILTHPGIPMVFWDHIFDWGLGTEIKALMKVRKDNGIRNNSVVSIQRSDPTLYAALIDNSIAMKIGSGTWTPTGDFTLVASGTGYAVWHKNIPVVVPGSFGGSAVTIPGIIVASDYNYGGEGVAYHDLTTGNTGGVYRQDDVDLEASTEGGFHVGWTLAGEWLKYNVNVLTDGAYNISARAATPNSGKTLFIEMDGVNITGIMNLPNTGGWQTWGEVTKNNVNITAGSHTVRIFMETADFNLKSVNFAKANVLTGIPDEGSSPSWSIYPNPAKSQINLSGNLSTTNSALRICNSMGAVVKTVLMDGSPIVISDLSPGLYTILINSRHQDTGKRFIKTED